MVSLWKNLRKYMWGCCGVGVEKPVENSRDGSFCCFSCEKLAGLAEKFFLFVNNTRTISGKQEQVVLVDVSTVSTVST